MDKNEIIEKLDSLINKNIKISKSIKHSSNWIEQYAGFEGALKNYDIGEEHEDVIALITLKIVKGNKVKYTDEINIWLDPRDCLAFKD